MIRKLFENLVSAVRAIEASEALDRALPARVQQLEARMTALEQRGQAGNLKPHPSCKA